MRFPFAGRNHSENETLLNVRAFYVEWMEEVQNILNTMSDNTTDIQRLQGRYDQVKKHVVEVKAMVNQAQKDDQQSEEFQNEVENIEQNYAKLQQKLEDKMAERYVEFQERFKILEQNDQKRSAAINDLKIKVSEIKDELHDAISSPTNFKEVDPFPTGKENFIERK